MCDLCASSPPRSIVQINFNNRQPVGGNDQNEIIDTCLQRAMGCGLNAGPSRALQPKFAGLDKDINGNTNSDKKEAIRNGFSGNLK